ncbi:Cytokinin riboside 5'-monophosphate phosphoribohydrolase LOG1-like protein [Drosera capensis]
MSTPGVPLDRDLGNPWRALSQGTVRTRLRPISELLLQNDACLRLSKRSPQRESIGDSLILLHNLSLFFQNRFVLESSHLSQATFTQCGSHRLKCFKDKGQITGETVGEVKAVADMHQRKAEMA